MEGREEGRRERRREGDREAGMEGGRKDETFSKYMADRKTFITVIRKIKCKIWISLVMQSKTNQRGKEEAPGGL